MTYDELANEIGSLTYRDKFRLAQLLIQKGRKEEEEQSPPQRAAEAKVSLELTAYVADRIKKLRPKKLDGLIKSINAMFQFQGGISQQDRDRIIADLQKKKAIAIDQRGRVSHPD